MPSPSTNRGGHRESSFRCERPRASRPARAAQRVVLATAARGFDRECPSQETELDRARAPQRGSRRPTSAQAEQSRLHSSFWFGARMRAAFVSFVATPTSSLRRPVPRPPDDPSFSNRCVWALRTCAYAQLAPRRPEHGPSWRQGRSTKWSPAARRRIRRARRPGDGVARKEYGTVRVAMASPTRCPSPRASDRPRAASTAWPDRRLSARERRRQNDEGRSANQRSGATCAALHPAFPSPSLPVHLSPYRSFVHPECC